MGTMNAKAKEKIYDEEIAPKLLELCKRCKELEMSFIASIEYDPENSGRGTTEFQMPDEKGKLSSAQRLVHWASRCEGNIDRLFLACDRHAREHGHSSIYLELAGNKNVKFSGNEFAAFTITKQ